MSRKLLLVDGHSIANRAFYGVRLMTNSKGAYTNALFGFFNILFSVMEKEKPDEMAIAFDLAAPTFRHQMYAPYKGTRSAMPEELREQIPVLQEMLKAAGISLLMKEGFEADDLIGTLAKEAGAKGDDVTILSGDRDLLQLVDDRVTMCLPKTKKEGTEYEIYHPAQVEEKYGVSPEGYLQMKGLMGDASDNIPGVPKIGEKTAMKIIQTFGSIEEAISHAEEVKPAAASKNLKDFREQARLSLVLATINTNVPDAGEVCLLNDESFHTPEFVEKLKEYELKQLLRKILKGMPEEKTAKQENTVLQADLSNSGQIDLFGEAFDELPDEFKINSTEQVIRQEAPVSMQELKIKIENTKKTLDKMTVVLCCDNDGASFVGAAVNDCYAEGSMDDFCLAISEGMADESVTKIFCDAKPIYRELMKRGMEIKGEVIDEMIIAYLLNATVGHYSPDTIASAYLGEYARVEDEIIGSGAKRISWTMAPDKEKTGFFLEQADILSRAADIMMARLEENGMKSLYTEVEQPLIEVLSSMENEGIRLDLGVLDQIGNFLSEQISLLQAAIYAEAGYEFNINSTKQLGTLLFEERHLPAGKKTKTGYSTSAEVLESLRYMDPLVDSILKYRQLTKLQSTYVEGLKPYAETDGRVHCSFQQAVTATGRLSCTDPNLQNIPIREDLGRQLRKAFVPANEDYIFMDADYSQIELRLVAHMSGDKSMIEAYNSGADIHRLTASQVLHIPYEEVTSAQRSSAKAVNFGIIYGMSAFSLASDLGVSNKEAAEYIDHYFARFPSVRSFLDDSVSFAKENGYGVTIFGRRRNIEELKAKNFAQRSFGERVAKNMPIQGSAADIIKIAMIRVYRRLKEEGLKSRLIVQVHDELLIETLRSEEEKVESILREEMQNAAQLKVPLTVEVARGENWYEAK